MLRENFDVVEITSNAPNYPLRFLSVGIRLVFSRKRDAQAIYIGWMGHPLVLLAKLISRKPIIFDAFISLYDSICLDRQTIRPSSIIGKGIYLLDRMSCRLSDRIILDTETHRQFFIEKFGINPDAVKVLYVCTDTAIFKPLSVKRKDEFKDKFIVGFHGSFIPLQGIEFILKAAKILSSHDDILIRLLGTGREMGMAQALKKNLNLRNVEFIDTFIPIGELPEFIRENDVGLGIFGTAEKVQRVIPNKVFENAACGIATISANTPGIQELFTDGKDIILCRAGDPQDLADAILKLKQDPMLRNSIAKEGSETIKKICDVASRERAIAAIVMETIYGTINSAAVSASPR